MKETDIRPFIGKRVEVHKNSGAVYQGTFWRTGANRYALVHVTFVSKTGAETTPGSGETRKVRLEDISTINCIA